MKFIKDGYCILCICMVFLEDVGYYIVLVVNNFGKDICFSKFYVDRFGNIDVIFFVVFEILDKIFNK